MFYESPCKLAQHFTKSNRYLTYIHFSEASHGSARRRVNGQIARYFHELLFLNENSVTHRKTIVLYCKSPYHLAQHLTKSYRYLTYMHFTEAPHGSARRRVNGQIASYFHEIIVLSRQFSNPSLKYSCFTNLRTTLHKTSQNLIDILPTSTSQRRLKEVLAAVLTAKSQVISTK